MCLIFIVLLMELLGDAVTVAYPLDLAEGWGMLRLSADVKYSHSSITRVLPECHIIFLPGGVKTVATVMENGKINGTDIAKKLSINVIK